MEGMEAMRTGARYFVWGALFLAAGMVGAPVGAVTLDNTGVTPELAQDHFVYSRLGAYPLTEDGNDTRGSASRLRALLDHTLTPRTSTAQPAQRPAPSTHTDVYSPGTVPESAPFSAEKTFNENQQLNKRHFGAAHHFYGQGDLSHPGWPATVGKPARSSEVMLLSLQYSNLPDPPQPLIPIPEPASTTLMLMGLGGMLYRRLHRP